MDTWLAPDPRSPTRIACTRPGRLLLVLLLLVCAPARATEYTEVLPNESTITFGYSQMGVVLEGRFSRFSAQIRFNPAQPEKAQARIDLETASIDTGSHEANEEVVRKPWFDIETHPKASFVLTGLKPLGGNRYAATGKLTIKGHTREVTVETTFGTTDSRATFDGEFGIRRLDYQIGEGEWADTGTVANEIRIRFHLVATSGRPSPSSTHTRRKS